MATLTHKQAKFCRNYIKYEGNASEAYRKSYNTKQASDVTVRTEAYKLLHYNPYVSHTIEKLQKKMLEKLEISVDTQVQKLENIFTQALADKEYAPAISAVNSQSKHLGLIADKPAAIINLNLQSAEKELRTVSADKRALLREIIEEEEEVIEGEFEEIE